MKCIKLPPKRLFYTFCDWLWQILNIGGGGGGGGGGAGERVTPEASHGIFFV